MTKEEKKEWFLYLRALNKYQSELMVWLWTIGESENTTDDGPGSNPPTPPPPPPGTKNP